MTQQQSLNEKAKEILRIAERHGVEQNFFFITTFERYLVQLKIMTNLAQTLDEDGLKVTKEYVKGRENLYTHPAIKEYNQTANAANKTVTTLMKIITTLRDDVNEEDDALLSFLRGGK